MSLTQQNADAGTDAGESAPLVPAQRTPPQAVDADHVRRHGSGCYWDVAECRWVCAGR